ncbi:MAG: PIG-L deacetylase family protein [Endomicrobiales bacterium]
MKYSLPVEQDLPGENILVIAPHPDDEAIGCAGAVRRHVLSGKRADVVFCTMDTEVRRNESRASAALTGFNSCEYLDFPVESLERQKDLSGRFSALFEQKKPDIVFLPFYLDNHVDHRAVNAALADVSEKKSFDFMVYAFPVWFPLYPNVIIDIGERWEDKKKIIECYTSQLATRDYVRMSYSLGQYWAEVKGHNLSVVETFFRASLQTYAALVRKILL